MSDNAATALSYLAAAAMIAAMAGCQYGVTVSADRRAVEMARIEAAHPAPKPNGWFGK